MRKNYVYSLCGLILLYTSTFSTFAYANPMSNNTTFNLKTSENNIGNSNTIYSPAFSVYPMFSIGAGTPYISNVFNATSDISISYMKDDQVIATDSIITSLSKVRITGVYKQVLNPHPVKQVSYYIENITTGEVSNKLDISVENNSFNVGVEYSFTKGNDYRIITQSIFEDSSFSISNSPILTVDAPNINITKPNKEYYLTSNRNSFPLVFDVKTTSNYGKVTISVKDIDSGITHLLVSEAMLSELQTVPNEDVTVTTYKYMASIPEEIKNGKFIINAF